MSKINFKKLDKKAIHAFVPEDIGDIVIIGKSATVFSKDHKPLFDFKIKKIHKRRDYNK